MSSEAMAWAKRCGEVGSVPQLVLMLMADWADHENKAWPGVKALAAMTCRSERTIIRAVKRLEEAGLIEKSARTAWCALDNPACLSKGPHKHRTSNLYRLKVGAVPSVPAKGSAAPGVKEKVFKGDRMSLMAETAESSGKPISDNMSLMKFNSDIFGRSIVTPVSPVCNRDTLENYSPDPTQPSPSTEEAADPDLGLGSVGSGIDCVDRAVAEVAASSPVATSAPPEGRRGPQKRPGGAKGAGMSGDGWGAETASDGDLAILAACVPEQFRVMDARGLAAVVGLLRERLDAGWRPAEIKRLLDSPPPAEGVKFMSRFVAKRLERLVAVGESPRAQAVAASRERERLARERAAVVDAREAQTAPSVVHMSIHDLVTRLAPGLSPARCARVELAVRQALADAWRRENPHSGKPSPSALLEVLAASGEQIAGRVIAEKMAGEVA
jgi:hypothetical protein